MASRSTIKVARARVAPYFCRRPSFVAILRAPSGFGTRRVALFRGPSLSIGVSCRDGRLLLRFGLVLQKLAQGIEVDQTDPFELVAFSETEAFDFSLRDKLVQLRPGEAEQLDSRIYADPFRALQWIGVDLNRGAVRQNVGVFR